MPGTLDGGQGCVHNNAREVDRMHGKSVDVNARNTGGWPGLYA